MDFIAALEKCRAEVVKKGYVSKPEGFSRKGRPPSWCNVRIKGGIHPKDL